MTQAGFASPSVSSDPESAFDRDTFLLRQKALAISAKYTVSPLHSFAPISDYTSGQAELIRHGQAMSGWDLALPKSEQKRLCQLYETERTTPWTLASADIIVLNRLDLERGLAPSPDTFRLSYASSTFKVWVRR